MRSLLALGLAAASVAALVAVAALSQSPAATGAGLQVVAAESVWGSIAAQLGGGHVHVVDVVSNPAADPHDYEPSAADARAFAQARLALVNGIGYDGWASRLLAANPVPGRETIDVGDVLGLRPGANPHRWYAPADVARVARAISAAYARLDPRHARAFAVARERFESRGLAGYRRELAAIRARYRGVAVGASEGVVAPLVATLGLRLLTPSSFLEAVAEGTEPSPHDVLTVERRLARREVAVWIENAQDVTPDVRRLTAAARAHGIPVVEVTETPAPAGTSFQRWQTEQLRALRAALARAAR